MQEKIGKKINGFQGVVLARDCERTQWVAVKKKARRPLVRASGPGLTESSNTGLPPKPGGKHYGQAQAGLAGRNVPLPCGMPMPAFPLKLFTQSDTSARPT